MDNPFVNFNVVRPRYSLLDLHRHMKTLRQIDNHNGRIHTGTISLEHLRYYCERYKRWTRERFFCSISTMVGRRLLSLVFQCFLTDKSDLLHQDILEIPESVKSGKIRNFWFWIKSFIMTYMFLILSQNINHYGSYIKIVF